MFGGARDLVDSAPSRAARGRCICCALYAIFLISSPMRSSSLTILTDRQHHAQVDRRRLALGDDLAALLVDADLAAG